MTAGLDSTHRMAGTVRFDNSVPVERLSALIKELRSIEPERWFDLHIRGAGGGKGSHYIAIHYILDDGRKTTQKKAVRKLLQFLCDRLGERPDRIASEDMDPIPLGAMGWSISTVDVMA
jgi:hypothetical protein